MDIEVIPPAERRNMVRRLLALCHTVNELVVLAESEPELLGHAVHIRSVLRDTVVDLVANGHADRTEAA